MTPMSSLESSSSLQAGITPAVTSPDSFYLRSGDRVVFYGDSITEHRFYTMFVETFILTRFPSWRVRFWNAGWGGDTVAGGPNRPIDLRLRRDVISHLPTVVTVMLGMNDGGWRAFDPKLFDNFSQGYTHITDVLQETAPRARLTLLRPSPFDDVTQEPRFPGGYNEVLQRYGEFVESLAKQRNLDVADLNAPVVQSVLRAYQRDETTARKIMGDRAHPSPAGHLLMAMSLLNAWRAPSVVSGVEINAKILGAVRTENTRVTRVLQTPLSNSSTGILSWTQQDKALPFPVDRADPTTSLVLDSSDFDQRFNNETLRVLSLDEGKYKLQINGDDIGNFSSKELREGINLALYQTPMMEQAQRVHALTGQRNRVQYAAWRNIELPLADINSTKYRDVLRALGSLENDLILQQRTSAQPRACNYKLTPVIAEAAIVPVAP